MLLWVVGLAWFFEVVEEVLVYVQELVAEEVQAGTS